MITKIISITLLTLMVNFSLAAPLKPIVSTIDKKSPTNVTPNPIFLLEAPYNYKGVIYNPKVELSYNQEGYAVLYGENKDGSLTANGEVFDSMQLSAAHATLPLPSLVEIKNLETGRSIVVRVNDRLPPENPDEIIQLSKRVFEMLNMKDKTKIKVQVKVLSEESKLAAKLLGVDLYAVNNTQPATSQPFVIQPIVPAIVPAKPIETPATTINNNVYTCPATINGETICEGIFIQVGAYSDEARATNTVNDVKSLITTNNSFIIKGLYPDNLLRVRIGAFKNVDAAREVLNKIPDHYKAKIVIEQK